MTRILAVSSGGGHWAQLQMICPAFDGCDLVMACTMPSGDGSHRKLTDCNLRQPMRVMICAAQVARLILILRPDVVVSTGAAPGALAVVLGKLSRARTVWIDSAANVECLSLSGRLVRRFSDLWLTQWPDLARRSGASFLGRVL